MSLGVPLRLRFRGAALKQETPGTGWVYDFWDSVRDYAFVREEDNVLILPPNKVYKTNESGVKILQFLDAGGRFDAAHGFDESRLRDVTAFFSDIKAICEGRDVVTETVAYDFDFTRLPILGEIAVTYRCNNRCRFCYAGCGAPDESVRSNGIGDRGVRDLERIIDIFRDRAKIPFFSFTGGEPLLRADLEELISYAIARKLRVNLITNGTLATSKRAASLYRAGLRTAQVSLESPDPAVHDALCASSGSWNATVAGIAALRNAGIEVQTNSTVTSANRESLSAMPEFLASIGVRRFSMNLFIPSRNNIHASELFVPYSGIGSFVDGIRKKAQAAGLTFFWYSPTPLCLYNPMAKGLGNKNCAASDGLISVDPEGNVLPCSSYPESVGNLLDSDFDEVWFSSRAAHFKNKRYAPDKCRTCGSFVACQAACPLYWDFAGYGELETAWSGRAERKCAPVEVR